MPRPKAHARWVLPEVVEPPDSVCFQVPVPNDRQHIAAFLGAIFNLAKPYNWENDNAHTALAVGRVWLGIFEALRRNNCECPPNGAEGGDDMPRLRQNPDNPCILEQECLPDQWVTLFDASLCLQANPGQPSPGGSGPAPGETHEICLRLSGNGQVLLPIAVQGNWTIEIEQRQGGWTDGGGNWYCPNGQSYTLGLCTGVGGLNGADPKPTALHMSIVAQIDSLWYDGNGLIVVPAGLTDQQVVFQANDASLSDNFGDVSFCVKVTNPPEAPIAIAYTFGSGPSSVVSGQVVELTATCCGGGGANDWQILLGFSVPVKVTFVNQSGFSCSGSGHALYMYGEQPAGTQVQPHYQDIDCGPNFWSPGTTVSVWSCETGPGQTVWSCQVKIDRA